MGVRGLVQEGHSIETQETVREKGRVVVGLPRKTKVFSVIPSCSTPTALAVQEVSSSS